MSLKGKTLFITGASRGIGLAIAKRAAADGANIVIAAKATEPNPKLPGTIYTAATEIVAAGGRALPLAVDIREGGRCVRCRQGRGNLRWHRHPGQQRKRYQHDGHRAHADEALRPDERHQCARHLPVHPGLSARAEVGRCRGPQSAGAEPVAAAVDEAWFAPHTAYTMAKYGMSMCTLGHSGEFRKYGIAVNSLWPRTVITTAALQLIPGVDVNRGRTPEILADAAYFILTGPSSNSGNFYIDDELLAAHGVTDLEKYSVKPGTNNFIPDYFVD